MNPDPHAERRPASPSVSVIVPVLNEERHLRDAVEMVLAQDYAGPLEVVLALGPAPRTAPTPSPPSSRRPTRRVRTVPNPTGRTPNGLNAAIAASRHDIIARVDGHAEIPTDYVAHGGGRADPAWTPTTSAG